MSRRGKPKSDAKTAAKLAELHQAYEYMSELLAAQGALLAYLISQIEALASGRAPVQLRVVEPDDDER